MIHVENHCMYEPLKRVKRIKVNIIQNQILSSIDHVKIDKIKARTTTINCCSIHITHLDRKPFIINVESVFRSFVIYIRSNISMYISIYVCF